MTTQLVHHTIQANGIEQHYVEAGLFDVEAIWREMASDLQTAVIPWCGHLPPEEQPEAVHQALLEFLRDWKG